MPVYVYRCEMHGRQELILPSNAPRAGYFCWSCDLPLTRDYAAEGVTVNGLGRLKHEREVGGSSAVRDLFLPTARDFESPDDPDGSRGIRTWADEHQPKSGNKRPAWPDVPRKMF